MSTDIRKARIEKGLSQDQAAALAGISGHRLARIERGGTAEQAEVEKILKALGKAKNSDNSRVGKGRPGGSVATKRAPAKKAATKKATTKKATRSRKPSKAAAAAAAADVL